MNKERLKTITKKIIIGLLYIAANFVLIRVLLYVLTDFMNPAGFTLIYFIRFLLGMILMPFVVSIVFSLGHIKRTFFDKAQREKKLVIKISHIIVALFLLIVVIPHILGVFQGNPLISLYAPMSSEGIQTVTYFALFYNLIHAFKRRSPA